MVPSTVFGTCETLNKYSLSERMHKYGDGMIGKCVFPQRKKMSIKISMNYAKLLSRATK